MVMMMMMMMMMMMIMQVIRNPSLVLARPS